MKTIYLTEADYVTVITGAAKMRLRNQGLAYCQHCSQVKPIEEFTINQSGNALHFCKVCEESKLAVYRTRSFVQGVQDHIDPKDINFDREGRPYLSCSIRRILYDRKLKWCPTCGQVLPRHYFRAERTNETLGLSCWKCRKER